MPDDNDYDDPETEVEGDSSVIRNLRSELKKAKGEAAEVATLRQELVIAKAGLDLSPKQQKALLAAHEGEMDVEALRATAGELGFAKAEAPAETPQVPAEEQDALQRVQDATAAAEPADGRPPTIEQQMNDAYKNGGEKGLDAFLAAQGIGINAQE